MTEFWPLIGSNLALGLKLVNFLFQAEWWYKISRISETEDQTEPLKRWSATHWKEILKEFLKISLKKKGERCLFSSICEELCLIKGFVHVNNWLIVKRTFTSCAGSVKSYSDSQISFSQIVPLRTVPYWTKNESLAHWTSDLSRLLYC